MSKNVIIASIVAGVALIGLVGGNMYASSEAEVAINKVITKAETSGANVEYESVSANVFGTVEVDEITLTNNGKTIFIENLTAEGLGYAPEDPKDIEDLKLTLTGIDFSRIDDVRVDETPDNLFEVLTYAAIVDGKTFDMEMALDTDRDEGIIDIQSLSLAGEDLGDVTFSAMFTSKSLLSENSDLSNPLELTRFSLTANNDGLGDRFIQSEMRGDEDLSDAKDRIMKDGEKAVERMSGFDKELIKAVLALIDGDTVTLYRDSEEPMEISPLVFMNPRLLQRMSQQASLKIDID